MESRSHANNFDLIRLLAALQVLFNHAVVWLGLPNLPFPSNYIVGIFPGVPIFFVVSGFLVTRSFLESRSGASGYFARRALRIYPGLWAHFVVILTMLAVAGALPLSRLADAVFWQWIVVAFVTGNDFYANLIGGQPFDYSGYYRWFPSGVLWTISVELGFYMLVPIAFSRMIRQRGLVGLSLLGFTAISLAFAWVSKAWQIESANANASGILVCSPAPYFWIFLIGAALAYYWEQARRFVEGRVWLWLAAYVALSLFDGLVLGQIVVSYNKPEILTVPRVLLLGITVIAFAHTWTNLAHRLRGIDLSYGVYLYHMPVIATLYYGGIVKHWWLWPVVLIVPTMLAAASWRFVEKPALRVKPKADALILSLRIRLRSWAPSEPGWYPPRLWQVNLASLLFLAVFLTVLSYYIGVPRKFEFALLTSDAWQTVVAPTRHDGNSLKFYGRPSIPTAYGAVSVPHHLPKGGLVRAAGTVHQGGLTLGILNQNGQWAATTAIGSGPFQVTVAAPLDGAYSIVIANNLLPDQANNDAEVTEIWTAK